MTAPAWADEARRFDATECRIRHGSNRRGAPGERGCPCLIASVIIVGILAIAVVGGTAFFFYRHVNTQFTPPEDADTEFAQARARFAGQKPLIEIEGRRRADPASRGGSRRDARGRNWTRCACWPTTPRAKAGARLDSFLAAAHGALGKKFSFLNDNGIDFDSDRVHLTLEDLERRGPGLMLDQADRRGSQVLVWTE